MSKTEERKTLPKKRNTKHEVNIMMQKQVKKALKKKKKKRIEARNYMQLRK